MRKAISIPAAILGFGSLLVGCADAGTDASLPDTAKTTTIIGEGAGWKPGQTIDDWVTYADYVLAVTPTDESEVPPTKGEIQKGEGLIQRRLTLRVDNVV